MCGWLIVFIMMSPILLWMCFSIGDAFGFGLFGGFVLMVIVFPSAFFGGFYLLGKLLILFADNIKTPEQKRENQLIKQYRKKERRKYANKTYEEQREIYNREHFPEHYKDK